MKPLKKTRLSSNKEFVATGNGSCKVEYQRTIFVDANGKFYASFPDHLDGIAQMVRVGDRGEGRNHSFREIRYWEGFVEGSSKVQAEEDWASLVRRCDDYLKNLNKEKVILLTTEMNIRYQRADGHWAIRKDNSFAKAYPTVGIAYQVCFRCGDKLLTEDNRLVKDLGVRKQENVTVIPFSEEREKFLEHIEDVLHKAAQQLNEFELALQDDPLQIDSIMKQGFLLEHKGSE